MARFSLLSAALIAATSVPALVAPAFAQDADGSVIWVRGSLRGAIAPSSTWTALAPDTHVKASDTLKTAEDSAAEILLPTGARVTMGASTIVRLVDMDGLAPRVMTGRIHLYAPPQGVTNMAAGSFHLSGTDAEAVVERVNGTWRVGVLAGTFRLVDASGTPSDIDAGKLVTMGPEGPQVARLSRTQQDDLQQGFQQGTETAVAPTQAPAQASSNGASRWLATGLSTLMPGVGQIYAGELPRGLIYLGLDCALIGTGFYGRFYGQNTLAEAAAGGLIGLNVISPLDAFFTTHELSPAPAPAQ